jgi:hypothetical protein
VLIYNPARDAKVYMTRAFVLHLLQAFSEELNVRAARRRLAELYASNALAFCARQHRNGTAPYDLAWCLASIPRCRPLREMVMAAARDLVRSAVAAMRRRQFVYNAQGIRGDGNYKLAKRIALASSGGRRPERPYTVVLAWCAVDGSLLQPVSARRTEDIADIESDLAPMLRDIQQARVDAGLSWASSCPVFHATDVYQKHRLRLRALYRRTWRRPQVSVVSAAASSDALTAHVVDSKEGGPADTPECRITGDPQHDLFALRRLVSPSCPDARDFLRDHADLMNRLSAAPPAATPDAASGDAPALTQSAEQLLRSAIEDVGKVFKDKAAADSPAADELRGLLRSRAAVDSPVWQKLFKATPPRGTLERLSRLLSCRLHSALQGGWSTKAEFRAAVQTMRAWYRPGRKKARYRRGMLRSRRQTVRVQGARTAWTKKVAAHYRRLLRPLRVEGLWAWRRVAAALRKAGISVQSGTVPVERLWSSLLDMVPSSTRLMSEEWWELLANLAYLRYNYRHFNHRKLPTWTEGDSLLGQRIETLASQIVALARWDEDKDIVDSSVFEPFL